MNQDEKKPMKWRQISSHPGPRQAQGGDLNGVYKEGEEDTRK